jgi:hypothetical protein
MYCFHTIYVPGGSFPEAPFSRLGTAPSADLVTMVIWSPGDCSRNIFASSNGSPRPKMGISPINTGNTTQNKDINSRQRNVEIQLKSEHSKSIEIQLNGIL